MKELRELGGEAWFGLGDRDLATHLYRTQRLVEGATKTDVTRELCRHWGVDVSLLPVTNDTIATLFTTKHGILSFQEYFVKHHHDVAVSEITVAGVSDSLPTPEVLEALRTSSRIIIAPSNPLISIDPILQVPRIRDLVRERRDDVVAISPIINGAALKGPADRLMREFGYDVSCEGVAAFYDGLIGSLIIDEADRAFEASIRDRGIDVRVTTTVMANPSHASQLAKVALT